MYAGLPGGSSSEGPATTTGLIFVALVTLGAIAGLSWMLFAAVP
jgi:hypothetical protein